MTLNRLILIKTAKNIVTSINNNTFIYGLTGSTEPGNTEPSIVRRNNKGKNATYFCDNDNDVNIKNLTININFLNYHFDDNG